MSWAWGPGPRLPRRRLLAPGAPSHGSPRSPPPRMSMQSRKPRNSQASPSQCPLALSLEQCALQRHFQPDMDMDTPFWDADLSPRPFHRRYRGADGTSRLHYCYNTLNTPFIRSMLLQSSARLFMTPWLFHCHWQHGPVRCLPFLLSSHLQTQHPPQCSPTPTPALPQIHQADWQSQSD